MPDNTACSWTSRFASRSISRIAFHSRTAASIFSGPRDNCFDKTITGYFHNSQDLHFARSIHYVCGGDAIEYHLFNSIIPKGSSARGCFLVKPSVNNAISKLDRASEWLCADSLPSKSLLYTSANFSILLINTELHTPTISPSNSSEQDDQAPTPAIQPTRKGNYQCRLSGDSKDVRLILGQRHNLGGKPSRCSFRDPIPSFCRTQRAREGQMRSLTGVPTILPPRQRRTVALDIEFEEFRKRDDNSGRWRLRLGWIAVSNTKGEVILDCHVKYKYDQNTQARCPRVPPKNGQPAKDFGVTKERLQIPNGAVDAATVEGWVKQIVQDRPVVVHDGKNDIKAFQFENDVLTGHPSVFDTQTIHAHEAFNGQPGLKTLASRLLQKTIQFDPNTGKEVHTPFEDAKTTMEIFLTTNPFDRAAAEAAFSSLSAAEKARYFANAPKVEAKHFQDNAIDPKIQITGGYQGELKRRGNSNGPNDGGGQQRGRGGFRGGRGIGRGTGRGGDRGSRGFQQGRPGVVAIPDLQSAVEFPALGGK